MYEGGMTLYNHVPAYTLLIYRVSALVIVLPLILRSPSVRAIPSSGLDQSSYEEMDNAVYQ